MWLNLTIFISFSLFVSCQTPKVGSTIVVSEPILKIAEKIGETDVIHNSYSGFSGEKSYQYKLFEELYQNAAEEELFQLTNHVKPTVRGYAFWGLAKKYSPLTDSAYISLQKDTSMVMIIHGCVGTDETISDFVFQVVDKDKWDLDCKKLKSKNE